ncbi:MULTISPECIES: glycosyltransferase family 4 protein [Corynebacterium]|uniref:glycosyltransferase family 4 protein n=1 Tax=Corynebacterium TaxID=1716 RepID=UPI001EF2FC47|nr:MULTISPECIES: glycosyltransferase family 4 protein [Corynebacterium]MCG7241874.1 glycosyltransferase family 4 protein [Corynebacterium kefirresidentii]MCG7284208.1 glycosyltransferase family 4 protein [Corynebacterium kefirresidentii]MDN8634496.1 glycosyltransferase family 4 protein [Corynebacterium kefirresidentii]MDU4570606.1 glycosyltransferase family 4 protein [Corynebacterium sp.]MDU6012767.1 glycosyltransferase family 4 protein [Corynebacterium sp.]
MSEKLLVICNAYPSEQALYRNGFIHRRVKAYKEAGLDVEVFYNHEPVRQAYEYEFDGVRVTVGNEGALELHVASNDFDGYLIHFAEPQRIRPLQKLNVKKPVIVWVHGFEAEAWYRRWFNFINTSEDIKAALEKKETYYLKQNAFFHDLMTQEELNVSFVNVSKWFQKYVVEPDNGAEFRNSTVIPNLVDEEVFPYREKEDKKRFNILSIRPFASLKYANDQTVGAILELSKRPYFKALSFTICGSGPMFDQTVEPLRQFDNVKLENRFFTQEEIRDLHAEHGIFLSPTRFDSQGVSMCEASSSGLVTISSEVAAVPEFIEHRVSGLLAQPESINDLADLIEELYFDAELFQRLSKQGSLAMLEKCGRKATIGAEVDYIRLQLNKS